MSFFQVLESQDWDCWYNEIRNNFNKFDKVFSKIPDTVHNDTAIADHRIWEDEEAYYVQMDVPGTPKASISVEMLKNKLVVSGVRTISPPNAKVSNQVPAERKFKATAGFGKDIDTGKITALVTEGVLKVVLPKKVACSSNSTKVRVD